MAKKTYAQEAKSIMNRYKIRLGEKFDKGDTLSLEAMNQELAALRDRQEQERVKNLPTQQFAKGGRLPMYQEPLVDRSNQLPVGLGVGSTGSDYTWQQQQYADPYNSVDQMFNNQMSVGDLRALEANNWMQAADPTATPFGQAQAQADAGGIYGEPGGIIPAQQTNPASPAQTIGRPNTGPQPYKSRVPYFGAIAQGLGSVLQNRNIDFGDERYTPQQVAPNLVDYSREREQFQRDRDIANQMVRRGAAGFGSRSKLMQNLQAGATGTQRQEGRLFSKSLQGEENQNAMIRNQAAQFNAQQRAIADRLNTQTDRENLLINEDRRAGRIGGVTGAITGYGKDLISADRYDQMLNIMTPENYQFMASQDSPFRRAMQISPVGDMFFRDTGERVSKKYRTS